MITMGFSMTSVGNHPTDCSTDLLAAFIMYKQLSTVKLSPAPGKVTRSLTSPPLRREPACDELPRGICLLATRPQQVPVSGQEHQQRSQHPKDITAHAGCHTALEQHTWDHKYHLIYIMLWIKGTKRLIALHLELVLHQRPQALIPVRTVLHGAWWDNAEVHPHSQPSQGQAQDSPSSHKHAEKEHSRNANQIRHNT